MPKKSSFLLTLIIFSVSFFTPKKTIGQNISDLDNRNGFKTLKFGMKIKDFVGQTLVPVGWGGSDSVILYLYLPSNLELKQVFDKSFENIYLVFDGEKKLVGIQLRRTFNGVEHYQTALEELETIIVNFKQLFGNITSTISDSKSGKIGGIWSGRKVFLQAFTNRLGLTEGSENNIEIFDMSFKDKKLKSGF